MVTALSFLIVLSIIVLAHEVGHFVVGRWIGVRIEEFALGFPPRAWSVRRGDTEYSINTIPLGGYVRFAGEDNPDVPDGLASRPRLQRGAVLIAGVTMNVILGILLFATVFATGFPTRVPTGTVLLVGVAPGSPAEQAGLKPGDIIEAVDSQPFTDTTAFGTYIRSRLGEEASIVVKRDGVAQPPVRALIRPNPPTGEGPLGVTLDAGYIVEKRTYPPLQALWLGVQQTWDAVVFTVSVPAMVLRGLIPADMARPVGPLGIGRIVGSAAEAIPVSGWAPLLITMALLSVSLAIVNILPLPGLDGGRLIFVILEWIRRGKRVDPQREAIIHFAGIMVLMGLILVITYYDIISPVPSVSWGP